ncbi:MAG: acylneuraminate cytidylyltransferase family protein, partial [bacterium]|nr:acylneuraminate cytidylyltransferase family protein [bacterium]
GIDPSGAASLALIPPEGFARRQDTPVLYDVCTVAYAVRPGHVLDHAYLFDGRVGTVLIPAERSLDIDTPFDLHLAELIVSRS